MGYASTVDTGQVQPMVIGSDAIAVTAVSGTLTANTVYLFAFELTANVIISALRVRMAATVTGTTDLGIYDVNGNKLASTGAVTNVASTSMVNNLANNLPLSPGQYYLAACPSNSTDTYQRPTSFSAVTYTTHIRQATNAGTSGVLPATLGAILIGSTLPVIGASVVGGL